MEVNSVNVLIVKSGNNNEHIVSAYYLLHAFITAEFILIMNVKLYYFN